MRKVIIDCDPGHDDALAILLAAKHLDLLGITSVAGNQTLDKVTINTLKILEFADLTPHSRGQRRQSTPRQISNARRQHPRGIWARRPPPARPDHTPRSAPCCRLYHRDSHGQR